MAYYNRTTLLVRDQPRGNSPYIISYIKYINYINYIKLNKKYIKPYKNSLITF